MAGTEYVRVSIAGAGGSDRVSLMWDTDEQVEDGRRRELQYVEDSTWFNLLQTARVFAVNRFDGVTSFDLGSSIAEGKRLVFAQYAHSSELLRSRKRCLPEYQDIDCGLCVVPLADGWYIEYWWSPENLAEHEEQRLLERQISEDEYLLAFDEKLRQCRLDGYSVIGYKSGQ